MASSAATPGDRLRTLWARLAPLPGGKRLVARATVRWRIGPVPTR